MTELPEPTVTGYVFVGIVANPRTTSDPPCSQYIDWESFRETAKHCRDQAAEWHDDGYIAQATVTLRPVEKIGEPWEAEQEAVDPQKSLFDQEAAT